VGAQRVGEGRRLHRIDPGAGRLGDAVGAVVDPVGVVAGPTDERVRSSPAIDRIVAGTAGNRVGERVAGAGEGAGAGERQVFDVGPQRIGVGRRLHRVGAFVQVLDDRTAEAVDDVGVVAETAGHRVIAGTAIERIVAGVADQRVIAAEAVQRV